MTIARIEKLVGYGLVALAFAGILAAAALRWDERPRWWQELTHGDLYDVYPDDQRYALVLVLNYGTSLATGSTTIPQSEKAPQRHELFERLDRFGDTVER